MKKIFSLIFIGVLCLVVLGCGSNNQRTKEGMIRIGNETLGYIDIPKELEEFTQWKREDNIWFAIHHFYRHELGEISFSIRKEHRLALGWNGLRNNIRNNQRYTLVYDGEITNTQNISMYKLAYNSLHEEFKKYHLRYLIKTDDEDKMIEIRISAINEELIRNLIDTYRKDR